MSNPTIMCGCGLYLIFDEFGMWFTLEEKNPDPLRYVDILFVILCFVTMGIIERFKKKH